MITTANGSIEVNWLLAVSTRHRSPEKRVTAVGTVVAFLLLLHPSLGSKFSPSGNSTQYHLLPDRDWEILNELAGKIIALVAPLDAFLNHARLNRTGLTVHERLVGEASLAPDIIYTYVINCRQPLLELEVVIPVCHIYGAHTTV